MAAAISKKVPIWKQVRLGYRVHRLTVIVAASCRGSVGNAPRCKCRCDCGNKKTFSVYHVFSGAVQSCGCRIVEVLRGRNKKTHGMSHSPEYLAWTCLKRRCIDHRRPDFKNYGGRGITVCKRWMKFDNFFADMGKRPSPKHSIDRINTNAGYSPRNCRWATAKQQATNRRGNRLLAFRGKRQCISLWAEETGLPHFNIRARLRKGWTVAKALTTPVLR